MAWPVLRGSSSGECNWLRITSLEKKSHEWKENNPKIPLDLLLWCLEEKNIFSPNSGETW